MTNNERQAIYIALLQRSVDGKLKRDTTKIVASIFGVSIRTIQRIWKQSKNNSNNGVIDVSHRRTKNCGRKRVQLDFQRIQEIPLSRRTTLDSLSCALNVGKTTLFRNLKLGNIRRHSNAIKPFLKEENKRTRLQFCISMLERNTLAHDPTFVDMYNVVHIDEKWFYMTKKLETYYLLPDEEDPLRTCKSKNFIGKVMFLAAIARPRFDAEGNEIFSGKIGIFPFVTKEAAKRSSANRIAGTLETKVIDSVGKNISMSFLIEKVLL